MTEVSYHWQVIVSLDVTPSDSSLLTPDSQSVSFSFSPAPTSRQFTNKFEYSDLDWGASSVSGKHTKQAEEIKLL